VRENQTSGFGFDELAGVQLVTGLGLCNRFSRHAHRSLSLGLMQAGRRRILLDSSALELVPGDLFLIPAGCVHAVVTLVPESYIVASIAPELLAAGQAFEPCKLQNARLAATLLGLAESAGTARQALRGGLLEELQGCGRPAESMDVKPAVLRKLIVHLQADCPARLGLDELAAVTGLSPWHLQRLCVAATGLSPHDHLELIRVREACRLLRLGEQPGAVAGATGFCDQSHFSRCFKKRTGTTPSRYAAAWQRGLKA